MSLTLGSILSREQDQAAGSRGGSLPLTRAIWQRAWHAQNNTSLDSIFAKIACVVFPIILIIAAGEGIVQIGRALWNKCQQSTIPPQIRPAVSQPAVSQPAGPVNPLILTQTVPLHRGSSQYDIAASPHDPNNDRPPACTFHALQALSSIAGDFDRWAERIQARDSAQLSQMQQQIIREGLRSYRQAVALDPAFQRGADLEHIRNRLPQLIAPLHFENTNQEMHPVPIRAKAIAERLFSSRNQKNIAWLKTANEESFAIVCYHGSAIVFDSHKNEMTRTVGKEQLEVFLTNKLLPHSQLLGNIDVNAFSYALGRLGCRAQETKTIF